MAYSVGTPNLPGLKLLLCETFLSSVFATDAYSLVYVLLVALDLCNAYSLNLCTFNCSRLGNTNINIEIDTQKKQTIRKR